MKYRNTVFLWFCFLFVNVNAQTIPSKQEVIRTMTSVNDYWQANNSAYGRSFWDNSVYHVGNLAAYRVTGRKDYLYYTLFWSARNQWKGAAGDDKTQWKYNYGEDPQHALFGDWQICFQVYADLYAMKHDANRIARAKEVMGYEISTDKNDYWWWADGLFMVMPVMVKMYNITHDKQYLSKLYEYYRYAESIMLDEKTHLFYRDARYVYPQHKSGNGKKDFWARGDGWVFAALARTIQDLPATDVHKSYYIKRYLQMAKEIISCQQTEGYWTRSMLDPDFAPGRETSGTALFTFGLAWGLNHGLLDKATYLDPALSGWHYLSKIAVQSTGKLGYVQPIGDRAIPGQVVDVNSTANFGVGVFLLAASEMSRLATK
jgi:unsaturated rhamnogalacturonyl hydrolase